MDRSSYVSESGATVVSARLPAQRASNKANTQAKLTNKSSRSIDQKLRVSARALRIGAVLELLSKALNRSRFRTASVAVVNELARLLDCQRVSLGLRGVRSLHVCAISGTVDIERRQQSVKALEAAMQEALDLKTLVVHPLPGARPATTSFMHAALAKTTGGNAICTIPLLVRGSAVGALLFERQEGFDAGFLESAKDAACFVGPVLEMQYRVSRPLASLLLARRERFLNRVSRSPLSGKELAALGFVAALLVAAVWPVTLRVSSPARVEGAGQQVVSAPVDGYIKSVEHWPGERVESGQLLITLDDADLLQSLEKWRVEQVQLDREYRAALSQDDAAAIVVARARLAQATGQFEQAGRELLRSQLVAPIDGVLVSGDLHEAVGMPVKRGQELLTVAPEGAYRIVAEIDEQDIGMITVGQSGNVVFAAMADQYLPVSVARISPVARTLDRRNMFEVDGEMTEAGVSLYHGLTGVARIDIDQRMLVSVIWLRVKQRLQRLTWRLIG